MKKTVIWILIVVMCLGLLASCKSDGDEETKDSETSSDTVNHTPETDHAPENALKLHDGKTFQLKMILPEKSTKTVSDRFFKLRKRLQTAIAAQEPAEYSTDFSKNEEEIATATGELLVGATNRPASREALRKFGKKFCFSVDVNENGIVMAGISDHYTVLAMDYFTSTYLPENLVAYNGEIYLKYGSYTSDPSDNYSFISYVSMCVKNDFQFSYQVEEYMTVAGIGTHKIMQGACADPEGNYAWFVLRDKNDNCSMAKYDLKTKELIKTKENIDCDHGNDCAYNPKNNTVIVSHCNNRNTMISVFNADTLERIAMKNVGTNSAVAYCAEKGRYVIMGGGNFTMLDDDFVQVNSFPQTQTVINTSQGIHCDSEYIYWVLSASSSKGGKGNIIMIYDWSGNYIYTMDVPEITIETEAMFTIGNDLYINCYPGKSKGGLVYKLTLKEE